MLDALYISAIGLQAQKQQLDTVASNLSNVNTPAYKRQSVDFSSVLDRSPMGQSVGTGTGASAEAKPGRMLRYDMAQGDLHPTGRPLDVAIGGVGFVEVDLPGGVTGYSRAGSLQVNAEGGLSLTNGFALKADIRVPGNAGDLQIQPDGSVTATLAGENASTVLGQIELVSFSNPEAMQYRGDGLFTAPAGSADPTRARPGQEGLGSLVAGNLEGSNVSLENEMVAMMLMQRVYELNSKVVQTADELMGMSNNLRRG